MEGKEKGNWWEKKNSNYDEFDAAKTTDDPDDLKKKIEELEKKKRELEATHSKHAKIVEDAKKSHEAAQKDLNEQQTLFEQKDKDLKASLEDLKSMGTGEEIEQMVRDE